APGEFHLSVRQHPGESGAPAPDRCGGRDRTRQHRQRGYCTVRRGVLLRGYSYLYRPQRTGAPPQISMQAIIEEIRKLFSHYSRNPITGLDVIPQSGSNRIYFRIRTAQGSCIATYNDNVKENKTFIYFSRHFRQQGCPVPEIYFVNDDCTVYFQEDFGDTSLLGELEKQGHNDAVYSMFCQSLEQLARLQIRGDAGLDYGQTITSREFGKQAILSDLLYFKYYFLDTLGIPYDKELLIDDFDNLSAWLTHADHRYFLFRDFQSRNILLKDGHVHFIDFQGGMKGALQYDVASLLWQAKAELSDAWK